MATLVWDGNGGNGKNTNWAAWNNWDLNRVPQSGDALVFAGSKKLTNWNDVAGLTAPSISIQSNGFSIDGAAIALGSGGLSFGAGNTATWGIPLTLTAPATPLDVSGTRSLNVTDAFNGSGGLVKTGTGTAQLSAGGYFTGTTKVAGGTLRVNSSAALQHSAVDYNGYGGVITFGGSSATFGDLRGSQALALTNVSGGAVALTIGGSDADTTYSGALTGSGSLTKVGSGRFTISGNSTVSGSTTILAGELALQGGLANSSVVIAGGTLSGGGSARSLRLDGGKLSPGDGVGRLTFAVGATLVSGTIDWELRDASHADQMRVQSGNVTLGGELHFIVDPGFSLQPGKSLTLIENQGDGLTSGAFANFGPATELVLNGETYFVRYGAVVGPDGLANDVVLERPEPDAPVAVADELFGNEDEPLAFSAAELLANDTTPLGAAIDVAILQMPTHGVVVKGDDGRFVYTPAADYFGLDEFVYQLTDEAGRRSQAAVTVQITAVNDAPAVTGATNFTAVGREVMTGHLTAVDREGDALKFRLVDGPAVGAVTMNADGSFRYAPGDVPATRTVTFTYAVSDGVDETVGTASITVFHWNGQGIRPDVMDWILANNPGLPANFMTSQPPDRAILLPDGRNVEIYRLDHFLDVNFRWDFKSRKAEKVGFVERQEEHLRKLMARPEFYHYIKNFRSQYKIAGLGKVSAERAYDYMRDIKRRIYVTANPQVRAPVGGGNGINAPSWAVWNQMNIFYHEACHVIGIGHDSGGLSGPLAGAIRDWDRAELWNYQTINLNSLSVPPK